MNADAALQVRAELALAGFSAEQEQWLMQLERRRITPEAN